MVCKNGLAFKSEILFCIESNSWGVFVCSVAIIYRACDETLLFLNEHNQRAKGSQLSKSLVWDVAKLFGWKLHFIISNTDMEMLLRKTFSFKS